MPYETSKKNYYFDEFDFEAFYKWAETRPYPVYFSSYRTDKLDKRFKLIWTTKKRKTLSACDNTTLETECLYTTHNNTIKHIRLEQQSMFD